MAASTTTNCRTIEVVTLLLALVAAQDLKRQDLVPLLLAEELPLLDDDLVQALARHVALVGNLRALLVAERGLEHRHDAQRVEHHVAGVLGVGGDALDAVHSQAGSPRLRRAI